MTEPCIAIIKGADGVLCLRYFGRDVGYISRCRVAVSSRPHYRAVSVRGHTHYTTSLKDARAFLLGLAA